MNKEHQILLCRTLTYDYFCGKWQKINSTAISDDCLIYSDFATILRCFLPKEVLKDDWNPSLIGRRDSLTDSRLRYCATHMLGAFNDLSIGRDIQFDYKIQLFCIRLYELFTVEDDFRLISDCFLQPESSKRLSHSVQLFYYAYRRRLNNSLPQRMTVVLGMHRSGTSALTGLLGNLGLSGPTDALGATENNLLGYWESRSLVVSSDKFLSDQKSHWSELYTWPSGWWTSKAALEWIDSYWNDLQTAYSTDRHFVLKDPRLCILFEGMIPCIDESFMHIDFLLILRPPVESVISLCKAEHISCRHALLLWIGSVLRSENLSRAYSRMVFTYQQLLESPDSILDSCSLLWGKTFVESNSLEAKSFLRPSLYRTKSNSVKDSFLEENPDLADLLAFADYIYGVFLRSSDNLDRALDQSRSRWIELLAAH